MDITKQEYLNQNVVQRNDEFWAWFLEQEVGEHTYEIKITNSKGKVIRHKITSKIQRLLQQNLHGAEIYEGQKYTSRERYERRKEKRSNSLSPTTRDRS